MFTVMGATGRTGSVVVESLLARGERVRAVLRDPSKGGALRERGAEVVEATLGDAVALARAFEGAEAAYVMLPPDPAAADFVAGKAAEVATIASAATSARLPHLVLLSSIGAQAPSGTGPIVTLRGAEATFGAIGCALTAVRAAYFLENYAPLLPGVRQSGILPSFLPAGFAHPIVATRDVGEAAAGALLDGPRGRRIIELAGPREAGAADAARALEAILGRPVNVFEAPLDAAVPVLTGMGFSASVAGLYREMLEGFAKGVVCWQGEGAEFRRGRIDLEGGLRALLA